MPVVLAPRAEPIALVKCMISRPSSARLLGLLCNNTSLNLSHVSFFHLNTSHCRKASDIRRYRDHQNASTRRRGSTKSDISGNRGRDHKSSGESSDTESAAGARGRLAALTARVRAALPKKTEKHSEEVHDEASEEKKGVVYAELALGDQTGDRAPPPPATEYAEIVYNTQEQAKEGEK
ncbi:hypothetical protein KGM_203459 [Danaus plexippus plexippus]|uniref:Uncharacterized protein n=1 Tax=Danaus plexippus plexippus TaxID=278856 RepID=A0A212F5U7_DANPL|nr:hypothetical protein KGM_203459 [Danaus plexippus plexippus]